MICNQGTKKMGRSPKRDGSVSYSLSNTSRSAKAPPALVPSMSDPTTDLAFRCTVRLHTSSRHVHSLVLDALPDDTLSDLKKRVVASTSVEVGEDAPGCAAHLYAWHTISAKADAAAAYIVDAAMESGGSTSIGPRIVTVGHLKTVHALLTGNTVRGTVSPSPIPLDTTFLTWAESITMVASKLRGLDFELPLGVKHEIRDGNGRGHGHGHGHGHGTRVIMRANPFFAEATIDPHLSSMTGDLRDVYHTTTDDDVTTLETLFAGGSSGGGELTIDMTCVASVVAHVRGRFTAPEGAWRAGFVRKYFPSASAWRAAPAKDSTESVILKAQHASERDAFDASRRAVEDVHKLMKKQAQSTDTTIERCVLTGVSVHIRPSAAQSRTSMDDGVGHDVLGLIFAKFRVTREVPVIRLLDGEDVTYKVARAALASSQPNVQDYLARCTRLAISNSTKSVRSARRLELQFFVTQASGEVLVKVRQDLSYTMSRNFSTSSANGGGSFDDVVQAHSTVNKRVVRMIRAIVSSVGTSSVLPVEDGLRTWSDLDRVSGSSSTSATMSTVSTVMVARGKVPTIKQIQSVMERMFPFFVPVTLPGEGRATLFLQYRRVDNFEHTDGLLQTLRLLRDDPQDEIITKIARAFGLSLDEASRRIDAELKNGKVPYIPNLLRSGVSVTLSSDVRGVMCQVRGATSAKQHRRVLQLVILGVNLAASGDTTFLEWVTDIERQPVQRPLPQASSLPKRRRFLEDWEDEEDYEEQDDGNGLTDGEDGGEADESGIVLANKEATNADEVEALLAAEIGLGMGNAETSVGERQKGRGHESKDKVTNAAILKELQRSDPALFAFRASRYSTSCGAVDGRQPIVVSKEELAKMGTDVHAGALSYGSSEVLAARNRFICPDVWCPRSRIGMSLKEFEAAHKKCPLEETPIVADSKYFAGKRRYPGFLNPSNHPDGLCMPCCFRLKRAKVGMCSSSANPGFMVGEEGMQGPEKGVKGDKEEDPRYLRNKKAPLDNGRYGLLPSPLTELFGGKKRCGSREDGSGQMSMHSSCLVRRGTQRHVQMFMTSVMLLLENPAAHDIGSFVGLVEGNLTPDLFVTLNDGRLARAIMKEVSGEGLAVKSEDVSRFVRWLASDAASEYVRRSKLDAVKEEAKTFLNTSGSKTSATQHASSSQSRRLGLATLDFRREFLLFSAMLRYIDILRDASIIKGHEHLLDLCTRPLIWLNPLRVNILLFEAGDDGRGSDTQSRDGDGAGEGEDEVVHFTCPFDGSNLLHRLRLADPFCLLLRSGSSYHPIVRVVMTRHRGIVEERKFKYDTERFIHQMVFRLLEGCKGSEPSPDVVGVLLVGLAAAGDPATWQVLDYQLHLTGVLTKSNILVSLPIPGPPLVGEVSLGLGTLYIADALRLATKERLINAEKTSAFLDRLHMITGVAFVSPLRDNDPAGGLAGALLLEHLGVFVGTPVPDARIDEDRRLTDVRQGMRALVKRFREALWDDAASASELVFLRHGFNPLPPSVRRVLMQGLVSKVLSRSHAKDVSTCRSLNGSSTARSTVSPESARLISRLVGSLLYSDSPLSQAPVQIRILAGALMLTDTDLMSSSLQALLGRGRLSLDGLSSGIEPVTMPSARVVRESHDLVASGSVSRTLLSLRRSLTLPYSRLESHRGSTTSLEVATSSVLEGAKMIPCHLWRALSLAQYLTHTELWLGSMVPLMVMENDRIATVEGVRAQARAQAQAKARARPSKTDGHVSRHARPGQEGYVPGLRDVEVLALAFSISVIVIRERIIVFDNTQTTDREEGGNRLDPRRPTLVLTWMPNGKWYLVMSGEGRLLWLESEAKKIHTVLQIVSSSRK